VLERGSEKVLSWPPAPLHDAIILSGRKTVEQARWTAGELRVKGGYGRQADGTAGLSPAPEIPVRSGTYASCQQRASVRAQTQSVRSGSRTVSDVDRYRKTYGFLAGFPIGC
jgi:hypothetical protein